MSSSFQLRARPNRLLRDHLLGVAENCEKITDDLLPICGQSLQLSVPTFRKAAYVLGIAHDVGKATRYFQDWLPPKKARPKDLMLKSHSMLSALYAYFATGRLFSESDHGQAVPVYVSLAIQAHHGALNSPTIAATKSFGFRDTLAEQISAIERRNELDLILTEAQLPTFSEFESQIESQVERRLRASVELVRAPGEDLTRFFLLNMLFSVLIDADRMDAAGLLFRERQEVSSKTVEAYVHGLSKASRCGRNANENVARGRDELFRILSEKAALVPLHQRIFSVTAPTGFGKTLAGLNFALKLRERLRQNRSPPRVIYVAPYLSILDQNFKRIAEALEAPPTQTDVLLLHHHLADMQYQTSDLLGETFSTLESELLVEGWNAEVIVTSFIQFFYAVIGSKASQLRKLHNLTGSIVVLDEVQTIPHEYWPLVRRALQHVTDKFGMRVVLMTATQPLIFRKDDVVELAADLPRQSWTPRVTINSKIGDDIELGEFVKKAKELVEKSTDKSTLIVMNTIGAATEVFNKLETCLKKYYLSANIVPAHRKQRITEIAAQLNRRSPLVLVSTQVIEAGVDLDFDTVLRDIGPVDSIIQVAGRCNRNGLRRSKESKVHIFSIVDSHTRARYANRIYGNYLVDKSREVMGTSRALNLSKLAQEYYLAVQKGSTDLTSRELLEGLAQLDYQKLQEFKLIDDEPSISVYVEVNENASQTWNRYLKICESEMKGLQRKEAFLKMRHDFYNYVINVPAQEIIGLNQHKGFHHISHNEIGVRYGVDTGFIAGITREWKRKKACIY